MKQHSVKHGHFIFLCGRFVIGKRHLLYIQHIDKATDRNWYLLTGVSPTLTFCYYETRVYPYIKIPQQKGVSAKPPPCSSTDNLLLGVFSIVR